MSIYSGFSHWKWWFSIAMLNYQRVWSTKATKRIAVLFPAAGLSSWPTPLIKSMPVWSNRALPIGLLTSTVSLSKMASLITLCPPHSSSPHRDFRLSFHLPLHSLILFVDWSQAFDSIGHPQLATALRLLCLSITMANSMSPIPPLLTLLLFFSPESDKVAHSVPISSLSIFALTADLHSFFRDIFSYTPWTYSHAHPLTDVEYADDTVFIARTNETLSRLLPLLQHLAARIGLLNGSKSQLLTIHAYLILSPAMSIQTPPAIASTVPLSSNPLLMPTRLILH